MEKEETMINHYSFGHMVVDGKDHRNDLKIIEGRVIGNWRRPEGHRLHKEDIEDIVSADPDTLVIGMGDSGNMKVEESVATFLEKHNIKMIAQDTPQAARTFNKLVSEGHSVAGAFHLTC
jgi:hypothetical protein